MAISTAVLLTVLATLSVACGGGGGGGDSGGPVATAPREGEAAKVELRLIAFKPERLSVRAGTTVTWTQGDAGAHTVTSGRVVQETAGVRQEPDNRFSSGELATGASFEYTFEEPGTFPYYCEIHPATMRGEITVT